ncbi:MAG: dihydrofolate reductase [Nitratireductor sp.]|nr:dihydrofolate reductase [Nitratireductor sp.]
MTDSRRLPVVSMVVAIAANGVIGVAGGLPWRLSSDLKRFKRDTMGKPVIMGRKTWESIGRPLPGRDNIVVTRQDDYSAPGAQVRASVEDAIALAGQLTAGQEGAAEICIIGGGQLYREAIARADRLYVTHVLAEPEGDTRFPPIDPAEWEPVHREAFPRGEKDDAETLYVIYERRSAGRRGG